MRQDCRYIDNLGFCNTHPYDHLPCAKVHDAIKRINNSKYNYCAKYKKRKIDWFKSFYCGKIYRKPIMVHK